MGADTLSRQGPLPGERMLHTEVVKPIWGQAQVDLFATQETAQCPLWYSLLHPAPLGLDAKVQTWPRLRLYAFPPVALLPGVLERVRRDGVRLLFVAPFWPVRVWFSDLISLLDGSPSEIPVRRDLLSQAGVFTPARRCRSFGCGPWGGATRSFRSLNRGCWDRIPIQSSLSEETVRLEVGTFTSWCGGCQLDPVNCPFGTVLEFVQACSSTGLTHSTLKVTWWQFCLPHLSWWAISGQSPPWVHISSTAVCMVGEPPLKTRKLYALKCSTSWCGVRQLDPANCPFGTVLEFVQACSSTGLTHSTLEAYVAAFRPTAPLSVAYLWVDTP